MPGKERNVPRQNGLGPRKELNYENVYKLASYGCPRKEIAAFFAIDVTTLQMKERQDPELTKAIENGYEAGRTNLRVWQRRAARRGQTQMLMWLGANELGQSNKVESRAVVRDESGDIDYTKLSDEDLAELQKIQAKCSKKAAYQQALRDAAKEQQSAAMPVITASASNSVMLLSSPKVEGDES